MSREALSTRFVRALCVAALGICATRRAHLLLACGISASLLSACSANLSDIVAKTHDQTATQKRYAALDPKSQAATTGHGSASDGSGSPSPDQRGSGVFGSQADVQIGNETFVREGGRTKAAEILANGDVVLNFSNTDVREVAQAVLGNVLGLNFVVDIESNARITLRTNRPISKSAVLPTLETTLAASGLALTSSAGVYRVVPLAKAKVGVTSVQVYRDRSGLRTGYGVVAVPLKYVAPSQMARLLEPLAPANSILRTDDAKSLLLLASTGPELDTLLDTVEMFDLDGMKGMSFGYYKIKRAKVDAVGSELKSILASHAASTGIAAPQLVVLQRLNSLLVISPKASTLALAQNWIERLDKAEGNPERRLFTYHVKNRKAKDIAELITSVYGSHAEGVGAVSIPDDGAKKEDKSEEARTSETPPETPQIELTTANARGASASEGTLQKQEAGFESAVKIVADDENNDLLISASQADYEILLKTIRSLDLVAPLVMIEVTIAEVKLEDGLKFGVEWFFRNNQNSFTFSSVDTGQILSNFPGFSYFFSAADVSVVMNAMSSITDVRIVSTPRVMVRDNKTATLQIGDKVPVVTATARSVTTPDAPLVQTVQYFDTGVILNVTPQVNTGGLVSLDVTQEVSNVAQDNAEVVSPTIQQRKLSSSIAIQSGEAVFLGGLMRENKTSENTAVPFLGDIPGVGNVFKTHSKSSERTELMVIITPKVLWGRTDAELLTEDLRQELLSLDRAGDRGTRAFGRDRDFSSYSRDAEPGLRGGAELKR